MFAMIISNKEYKVKFGTNSFIDTDLMDRTKQIFTILKEQGVFDDSEEGLTTEEDDFAVVMKNLDMYKDILIITRELLQTGFKRYNPVDDIAEVGDLIDDYLEEKGQNIMFLFAQIVNELLTKGFLGDQASQKTATEIPQVTMPQANVPQTIVQPVQPQVVQMPTQGGIPTI